MMESLKKANEAIFGYGSPTTMGVFRILMGSLAFINLLMIAIDFDAWFSERGFVPQALGAQYAGTDMYKFDMTFGATNFYLVAGFYALVTLAAFFTAIGFWTRVSSIFLFLGIVTLHQRNQVILHGGDTLLRACCFYMAIAPSGASCSVDRLIALWKGKAPLIPPMVSLWPQRMLQLQVAIVYFTTVWHKWTGTAWRNGTATWYVPQLSEFKRFPAPAFVDALPLVKLTTYGTLAAELCLATLVFFKPFRKWVLLVGLIMHGTIEYRFNIPLFGFMMTSTYIAFYDGEEITDWFKRLGARFKKKAIVVQTPKGTRLAPGPANALEAADPLDLVTYATKPGESEGWTVEGGTVGGIARRSMGVWLFAWIPGLWSGLMRKSLEPAPVASVEAKDKEAYVR